MIRDYLFWITLTILAIAVASTAHSFYSEQYLLAIFSATLIGGSIQNIMQMYHQAKFRKEALKQHARFEQSLMETYNEETVDKG